VKHLRAFLFLLALAWTPAGVELDPEQSAVRDQVIASAEAHGVDPDRLLRVSWCESHWRAGAVGDRGLSLGVAQLHRDGLRSHFHAAGYLSPLDVWESTEYMAQAFAGTWASEKVDASHWTCARKLGLA
jgi:hypothetical protein